jgi:glutamine cyclotransferase
MLKFDNILFKPVVIFLVLFVIIGFSGCNSFLKKPQKKIPRFENQVSREEILSQKHTPVYTYEIVKAYPHDVRSYTEGLLMDDGFLYESTGLYGKSKVMKIDIDSGKALKKIRMKPIYFGEGITIKDDDLYHLSYKSNIGFVYDKHTFELKRTFNYPYQGWGMTTDGSHLIMSDGSSALLFFDPETLEQRKYLIVKDIESEVGFLNELEYIKGRVFANIWETNLIAIISPEDGRVTAWIDLTGINPNPQKLKYPYVLNGIAHLEAENLILIAGKCWPEIFGIRLVPLKNVTGSL